jgi:hypothetical protein
MERSNKISVHCLKSDKSISISSAPSAFNSKECSICFEGYNCEKRKPLVINCGHTFCEICLKQIIEKDRASCPICKFKINRVSIKDIPVNYAILDSSTEAM